jgi:hypothetical protein
MAAPAPRVPIVALALPWLDDDLHEARADLRLAPALAWLLERSSSSRVDDLDWRTWLLGHVAGGAELLCRHPPGPTRRILARGRTASGNAQPRERMTRGAATWACAQPVHLATGIDHLWLEPSLAVPLTSQETSDIAASLNAALAERAWSIVPLDAERWLLACEHSIECESSPPADAAGRAIRSQLPEGRDARLVRAVMNEMQMILHAHPVNEQRAARGLQPVNAVWLWGFGPERAVTAVSLPGLVADDEWLREIWQLHGQDALATSPSAFNFTAVADADLLVAASAPSSGQPRLRSDPVQAWADLSETDVQGTATGLPAAERVRRAGTEIFAPLKAALESRGTRRVELFSGNAVHSLEIAARRSLLDRWLSLFGGRR